jgi:choline dehydrogenase-like flavoprotein
MDEAYPVLKRDYPLNETNLDYWVKDEESPYTEVKRFDWYRGYHVGGRSLMWGRQSYRLSDLDFEANAKEGIATDWPIRYAEIAPWYDKVEKFAGIAGSLEGLAHLPDGQFQPAMPLNCGERWSGKSRAFGGMPFHLGTRPTHAAAPGRKLRQPQRLLVRLPVRRLLQHAVVHAAGGVATGSSRLPPPSSRKSLRQGRQRAGGARARRDQQPPDYTSKIVFLCVRRSTHLAAHAFGHGSGRPGSAALAS